MDNNSRNHFTRAGKSPQRHEQPRQPEVQSIHTPESNPPSPHCDLPNNSINHLFLHCLITSIMTQLRANRCAIFFANSVFRVADKRRRKGRKMREIVQYSFAFEMKATMSWAYGVVFSLLLLGHANIIPLVQWQVSSPTGNQILISKNLNNQCIREQ